MHLETISKKLYFPIFDIFIQWVVALSNQQITKKRRNRKTRTMKKVIFAIGLVVALASCGGEVKEMAPVAVDSTTTCVADSAACPLIDTTACCDSTKN